MVNINYNPDVLSCLANLSNDEVFTPPKLVGDILDMLPVALFSDKSTTFLDPVSKSGVFLREIAKRLMMGLEAEILDQQQRINHIFENQLYGIAITELTALLSRRSVYCSKIANGKYSICETFNNENGNIKFDAINHIWKNGKCTFCNASEEVYSRDEQLETHAYQFIHTDKPEEIFKMKFDVIIGNPPYQLSDGGHGRSASPIYHKFVEQAKKLKPRFLTMIIPARWYAGGKGLDAFRESMLNDSHIRKLVDFENSSTVFPGVDIAGGICYFLWDRDNQGLCEITNEYDGKKISSQRALNEFDTFIRHSQPVPIIRKVLKIESAKCCLNKIISSRKPFSLPTNYKPVKKGIKCHFIQKIGLQYANPKDVTDNLKITDKWKLLIPRAPIAGQTDFSKPVGFYYNGNTRIAKPGEICTESWLVACSFRTEEEVLSFKSYLFTKIARFLLLQTVVSQDITRERFVFIPYIEKYDTEFTDEILRKRWNITDEEWDFIDSKIKTIEL
ncbi:type III restriction system endonuclease, putative [uncultured Gammaproteobacteria bacterium]|nr:type III restriction system endonuclease, putative [uncultured Gammaproteobacteria bacterium]CAC9488272.1 type III restriction system endonuclease, putative [uncultured Gammaproteobacteria bacterium]CAC9510665.1 type III restriction system endonuclease, putative [uncultured Gammaproteobacteria bacterium]CAC9519586.1 type III restriction system endonuclease, putative [uncultured Gammaproteobacteria bacterium]CAC9520848.1 type III restriction system endonuclease, putative [uncultured Gammaprot